MRYLPVLAAVALLVAYGVGEGLWTHRWMPSNEPARFAARLNNLPATVGLWEGTDELLDARQGAHILQVGMTGFKLRRYVNTQTKQGLYVQVYCGPPGPTSVHTPEICQEGAGYKHVGSPKSRKEIVTEGPFPRSEFWVERFDKDGPIPDPQNIAYSWSATGQWHAPDSPRFAFGSHAALYKLYVIYQPPTRIDESPSDPTLEFLKVFLPELDKALFPARESSSGKI
jgi:Protein of unknown function (DUF3485)